MFTGYGYVNLADDFATRLAASGRPQVCLGHSQGPSFGVQTDHGF